MRSGTQFAWLSGLLVFGCGDLKQAELAGSDGTTTMSDGSTSFEAVDPTSSSGGDPSGGTQGASGGTSVGLDEGGTDTTSDGAESGDSTTDEGTTTVGTTGEPRPLAQTCQDIADAGLGADDGPYTLYLDGDPEQPWTAFCVDLGAAPRAYLTLPAGAATNTGIYDNGDDVVRTSYSRVAIDELSLLVDIDDMTYATSVGSLQHGPDEVTGMSFGVAMSCEPGQTASASIDLHGTPFVLELEFCTAGFEPMGSASTRDGGRTVSVQGGGNCGWTAPGASECPYNPFNGGTGEQLALLYSP